MPCERDSIEIVKIDSIAREQESIFASTREIAASVSERAFLCLFCVYCLGFPFRVIEIGFCFFFYYFIYFDT